MPQNPNIRPLIDQDFMLVKNLYFRASDYVMLETGLVISDALVADFFSCCPPSRDLSQSVKLGLFLNGCLVAIADVAFGYPNAQDAYIGLMLVSEEGRGRGFGHMLTERIIVLSRNRGASRLLLCVLDCNVRAQTFWHREGFVITSTLPTTRMGRKIHIRHEMRRSLAYG